MKVSVVEMLHHEPIIEKIGLWGDSAEIGVRKVWRPVTKIEFGINAKKRVSLLSGHTVEFVGSEWLYNQLVAKGYVR